MKSIQAREYDQLLDLAVAVLEETPGDPPWAMLAELVQRLLGGRAAMVGDFDADTGDIHHIAAWTHAPSRPALDSVTQERGPAHPLAQVFATGHLAPLRVSDVLDRSTWRRSTIYRDVDTLVDHCVEHLGIPLSTSAGRLRSIVVVRSGRDFTDREVALSRRAQPLLVQVARLAAELRRGQGEARTAPIPESARCAAELGITPRELVVLRLLATNLTAAAIGHRLGVTAGTVSKHQENLYRKLGTRDRLTTVLTAQRLALIAPHADRDG